MKLSKKYKFAKLTWDQDNGRFLIWDEYGGKVVLRKTYIFVLVRFCLRIIQKYFVRGLYSYKKFISKRAGDISETSELSGNPALEKDDDIQTGDGSNN